jgi:flagellar FliL protein
MKLAVMALLALLLVGAGAGGAYFFFDKPAEASAGPVDEAGKAAHEAKVAEAKEGAEAVAQEQFVPLEPLILPVIDARGVTQTVSIVVSIAVPDQASADEVKHLSPRLRDAYIQDMYGVLNRKQVMENGVLKVALIKDRFQKVSTKVLGEGKVNDVLLQVVQQRRV